MRPVGSERASVSAPGLQPPAEEKDRAAEREQSELASDVPADYSVEERDPRHQEPRELQRAGEGIHGANRRMLRSLRKAHARDPVSLFDPFDDVLPGDDLTEDGVDPVEVRFSSLG